MSDRTEPMSAATRWSLYSLLIVIAASLVTARIMRNRSPDAFSPTPFQSANDKSRWCTIRALGDHAVYSIEHLIFYDDGSPVRGWHTIDLVRHRGPDGREHYYSSKPTLLSTLLAGEYWLLKQLTGMSLAVRDQVWFVSRLMLVLTNVVPLAIALVLLARIIDQLGRTDWGRLFAFTCAAVATFVTTFSSTLNNHSLAACTLIFALSATIPIWQDRGRWWHFALAGLFFAVTATNELPALSMLVLAAAAVAWKSPLKAALLFTPPALLVAAAAVGTNYYAHDDWRTPYAHRQDGWKITSLPAESVPSLDAGQLPSGEASAGALYMLDDYDIGPAEQLEIVVRKPGRRWELWDPLTQQRFALVLAEEEAKVEVRRWDNWYDYPGTHWDRETVTGLDRGEPSPLVYALHCLVGHHGLFSLTPIWLLSAAGCWVWLTPKPRPLVGAHSGKMPLGENTLTNGQGFENGQGFDGFCRALAVTTVLITLVVVTFYLTRPQMDRNYGGGTCCLRWLIWLTPLWLVTLLPAADRLGRSWRGRTLALALFAVSVFSAHYAADNPWANPWIYGLGKWLGWYA
jgi:hypothetical protein